MKFSPVIIIIELVSLIGANKHSWGERSDYYNHHMYDRTLIDDKNSVPKDYTIIYKYYGAHYKPVAYIEIDVNTISSGHIDMNHGTQEGYFKKRESIQVFNAKIEIWNAQNVTVNLKILGMGMTSVPSYLRKLHVTKSLTFVYAKDSYGFRNQKPFSQNSIGTRRKGDELLHFESRKVMNNNRFPSRAFEYPSEEYLTYVGFSFDSPTAMVMVNTTFVGEQEFYAVVYDMNTEHFVANMSVYGIKSSGRPDKFLGVI